MKLLTKTTQLIIRRNQNQLSKIGYIYLSLVFNPCGPHGCGYIYRQDVHLNFAFYSFASKIKLRYILARSFAPRFLLRFAQSF